MAREGSAGFTSRPRRATGLPPHPLSPSPLGRPGHGAGRGDLGVSGRPGPLEKSPQGFETLTAGNKPEQRGSTPERDPDVDLFRSRHPLSPATGLEATDVL